MSLTNIQISAERELKTIVKSHLTQTERAQIVKRFIKAEEASIFKKHQSGASGLEIAEARSNL